jgi:hypothetical protein
MRRPASTRAFRSRLEFALPGFFFSCPQTQYLLPSEIVRIKPVQVIKIDWVDVARRLQHHAVRRRARPGTPLGLVNPSLEQACAGHVSMRVAVGGSIRPGLRRLRYWCGEPIQGFRFSLPSWGMLQSRTGEAGTRPIPTILATGRRGLRDERRTPPRCSPGAQAIAGSFEAYSPWCRIRCKACGMTCGAFKLFLRPD